MLQPVAEPDTLRAAATTVRHLRHVLLWPLRLVPPADGDDSEQRRAPWRALRALGDASPWKEQDDEYTGDADDFHERHYNEFIAFLPYVQRFLYGEGRFRRSGEEAASAGSPMRVFRRRDIAAMRVVPRPDDAPVTLQVAHIDLYFFYGVDIVLLNVELAADQLPLPQVQELLYRGGRAYPAGWEPDGSPTAARATGWRAANGWMRKGRCCAPATPARARSSWPTPPSTARRASQPTGSSCSRRWSTTTRTSPARCASARSSTTACR